MFWEVKRMKKKSFCLIILLGLVFLTGACKKSGELVILHQVTGPIETNCYLLYDARTGEAALIDVGGPIDTLLAGLHSTHHVPAPYHHGQLNTPGMDFLDLLSDVA